MTMHVLAVASATAPKQESVLNGTTASLMENVKTREGKAVAREENLSKVSVSMERRTSKATESGIKNKKQKNHYEKNT